RLTRGQRRTPIGYATGGRTDPDPPRSTPLECTASRRRRVILTEERGMRALKIAGWAILSVVALMVLAGIVVAIFVDPNDYKDDIAKAVHDRTGRDLKLDGKLSLSIFPWLPIQNRHAVRAST